jgi:transposase
MKNKYLKGAHLSERKVRELLRLFCEDLTATQIANITGISRITVNAYFKLIRTHIARFCEEKNPLHHHNGNVAFLPMENGANSLSAKKDGKSAKKAFYGIFKKDEQIYTDKMPSIESNWLYDWMKGREEADADTVEKFHLNVYSGIADFNTVRLLRLNASSGTSKGRSQIDEIDLFWGMLKARLVKFRGLNGNTLYLHVKETEFRYNYRDSDLFDLLLDILHKQPLHYSKVVRQKADT